MSHLLRKLKIYHLVGIGDYITIDLNEWIEHVFIDLTISKQLNGDLIFYSKVNIEIEISLNSTSNNMWVDYLTIWMVLEVRFKLNHKETQNIIIYIMFKYYNIQGYIPQISSSTYKYNPNGKITTR
jgi:hypothetical protein